MLQDSMLEKRNLDTVLGTRDLKDSEIELEEGEIPSNVQQIDINSLCGICTKKQYKYKCPNCLDKHCSVTCYKVHQDSKKCTGKVDPTKFVKQTSYNVNNLRRDFDFLSNIITDSNKTRKKLSILEENLSKHKELLRYKILKHNAKRRNVVVANAPPIIQRHRKNISFYYTKDKIIYWGLEVFQYVCVDDEHCKIFKYTFLPNQETKTLKEVFGDFPWDNEELIIAFKRELTVQNFANLMKTDPSTGNSDESSKLIKMNEKDNSSSDSKFTRSDNTDYNLLIENTYFKKALQENNKKIEDSSPIKKIEDSGPTKKHSNYNDNKNQRILGELDKRIVKQVKSSYNSNEISKIDDEIDQPDLQSEHIESEEIEEMMNENEEILPNFDQDHKKSQDSDIESPKQQHNQKSIHDILKDSHFTTSYVNLHFDMKVEDFIHSMKIIEFPTQHLIPEKMMGSLSRIVRRKLELVELN